MFPSDPAVDVFVLDNLLPRSRVRHKTGDQGQDVPLS
jgi:hypothetical protein